MRALCAILLLANLLLAQTECKEIESELKRLQNLRDQINAMLKQNTQILDQIKQERASLERLKQKLAKEQEEIKKDRYKKLAKDFANMDPEAAGDKLSKLDPKIAAYILLNMNSRKAGEALNYTDPVMVSKITKILTELKKNAKQSR